MKIDLQIFNRFFILGIIAVVSQSLGIIIFLNTVVTFQQTCQIVGTSYCQQIQPSTNPHLVLSLILLVIIPIYSAVLVWFWTKKFIIAAKHLLIIISADTLALTLYWILFIKEII